MRHFVTMSLVPLIVELPLCVYCRTNYFEGSHPPASEQNLGHTAKLA